MQQLFLAASASGDTRDMYEPVNAETALAGCCGHLLSTIGLEYLYPERAAQLRASAGRQDVRSIPHEATQAILRLP